MAALEAEAISARGQVGTESPLEAIADALATFPADEIVLATAAAGHTNWLEQDLVERARKMYSIPASHVVVERPARVVVQPDYPS